MLKKFVSVLLCVAMAMMMCIPTFASNSPVDPDEVYAEFIPELAQYTPEEIENLSEDEIEAMFTEVFSVSSSEIPGIDPYVALKNLVNFYHAYNELQGPSLQGASNSVSTKNGVDSYTGFVGVGWERDFDKSPLSLNEVVNNWWVISVSYATKHAARVIGACEDPSVMQQLAEYIAAGVAENTIREYFATLYPTIPAYKLYISSALVAFSLTYIYDFLSTNECSLVAYHHDKMGDHQMLEIVYTWTGSSFIFTYERKTFDYSSVHDPYIDQIVYTYKNIPNPVPNCYGFWTEDELGITP